MTRLRGAGLCLFAAAAAGVAFLWYGAVGRGAQIFGRSVFRGRGRRRSVALTFDDGPSDQTLTLVRYLEQEGIPGTFFVCGLNVQRHEATVRATAEAGHEIGNHTLTHRRLCPRLGWRMNLLSRASVYEEVAAAQQVITHAAGRVPRLFRAPYGLRWWGLRRAQRSFGLLGVMWTVIGHDWEWDANRVVAHILREIHPGGIICLHDGRETRPDVDISATLQAVCLLVPELKRLGYAFETVSDLLLPDRV